MEAPKKLYIDTEDRLSDSILYGFTEKRKEDDIEYIRKDIVGDMLSIAEDHAYLAGQATMREKLSKLEELADKMYYAAQYLTTDASKLRKAMRDYRHYVIYELKEGKQ